MDMPVRTTISETDLPAILSNYDLGEYRDFKTFAEGAGHTLLLEMSKRKVVLRYYEKLTEAHVDFEVQLLNFLQSKNYPAPAIIKNRSGESASKCKGKPYVIVEFVEGKHGGNGSGFFDAEQAVEVVKVVAQLHNLTKDYRPDYFSSCEVFDVEYCWGQFQKMHPPLLETEKGKWFRTELDQLEFPAEMPKGVCHGDLNYGNFLFKNGKVVAVLDFDMPIYTFLIYDIANLIYWWPSPPQKQSTAEKAAQIVREYSKWRELSEVERAHILDALKLITLLGISWSGEEDFEHERERLEHFNAQGFNFAIA
jgi:homoserine kinase type II